MLWRTELGSASVLVVPPGFCGIKLEGVASAAESKRITPWRRKREAVQRRLEVGPVGVRYLDARKVRKAPSRKVAIETSVVSQACGLAGNPAVERPRMTVLPVYTAH